MLLENSFFYGFKSEGVYPHVSRLGCGGLSYVRLGVMQRPGKGLALVAIKKTENPQFIGFLQQEYRVLQSLSQRECQFIPLAHAFCFYSDGALHALSENQYSHIKMGLRGPKACIVMDYLPGRTLFASRDHLSILEKKHVITQTFSILADLHEAGVAHGDIKLENMMLDAHNTVKIFDFSCAYFLHERPPVRSMRTAYYAPPEPSLSAKADVYSLAMTIMRLIVLTPISRADERNHSRKFELLSVVKQLNFDTDGQDGNPSSKLYTLLSRMMSFHPEARPTALEAYQAWQRILLGEGTFST